MLDKTLNPGKYTTGLDEFRSFSFQGDFPISWKTIQFLRKETNHYQSMLKKSSDKVIGNFLVFESSPLSTWRMEDQGTQTFFPTFFRLFGGPDFLEYPHYPSQKVGRGRAEVEKKFHKWN